MKRGRVLNRELYAQLFQKLIYLHLFADCFMKIFPQSSDNIVETQNCICSDDGGEIVMKQSEKNADKLTSEIFVYFPQSSRLRYSADSAEFVNMFWFINM